MSFDTLGLSDKVVAAVKATGYTTPTPIQEQAIPHVLERRDVLGLAQTGTGKTASFVLPMLTLLEHGRARARMPRTLILEPTRELASQVQDSFGRYGVNHKLSLALLIGGVSFDEQDKIITRVADVLIATPGRLLDHFERGRLLLTGVEILVIDEADRMLDMGFIPDIERIVKLLPFTRQTLFFSATMPPEITQLVDRFLSNPVRVEVSKPASTGEHIIQQLVTSGGKPDEKRATLRQLIDAAGADLTNAIIFCNRKRDVATLYRSLERHGYSVGSLHGDMDQYARLKTLDSFRDGQIKLLVASDVAARGLDIPAVSHVFNFDVPTHSEDYVHRIGRTGRAGRPGLAQTIVTRAETKYIQQIEKLTGKPIEWAAKPEASEGVAARQERPSDEPVAAEGEGRNRRRGRHAEGEGRSRHGGGRRGGKGGRERGDREARPAQDHTESRRPSSAERPTRAERPGHSERPVRAGAPSRPRAAEAPEDASRAVGFSDHVPAFLLRPVRMPSGTTEALEEV
jgi:superfamily II DNA/RNA helicase